MLILILLFSYLGFYFGGQNGMIIAFLIAAGMNFFSYWFSDKIVLKMYKAHQITEADHPRFYSIVQNISSVALSRYFGAAWIPGKGSIVQPVIW